MRKKRVYIDIFYYKTALSGLKTYIEELVSASKTYGSDEIEYFFSHDIKKITMQMEKKKNCFPKKLLREKKSIFSKYVTEYILTNPINISVNTSKHETRSKFLILGLEVYVHQQLFLYLL